MGCWDWPVHGHNPISAKQAGLPKEPASAPRRTQGDDCPGPLASRGGSRERIYELIICRSNMGRFTSWKPVACDRTSLSMTFCRNAASVW